MKARMLCALLLAAFGVRAWGQPPARPAGPPVLPWAGAPAQRAPSENVSGLPDTHAWIVRESSTLGPQPTRAWQTYHVPPRRLAKRADGKAHGSPDGSLRPSANLTLPPEAIAAWGEKAWFIFEAVDRDPKNPEQGAAREVLAVRAVLHVGDFWKDDPSPANGGMLIEPSMPGRGRLAGFIGTPIGPAALLDHALEPGVPRWTLRVLADGAWREVDLPQEAAGLRSLTLVASAGGLSVVGVGSSILEWWRAPIESPGPAAEGQAPARLRPAWSRSTRPLGGELTGDEALVSQFVSCRGGLYAVAPSREDQTWASVRILECEARGPLLVAAVPGARGKLGLLPMEGLGRLGLVWDVGKSKEPLAITEISLASGAVLFSGPSRAVGLLTRTDLSLLLLGLSLLTASILVFVLRSDSAPEAHLPEEVAIADPMRRLIASALDLSPAVLIASRMLDVPLSEFLSADGAAPGMALQLVFLSMAIGFVTTAVSEVFFARSLGKLLTGCAVIQLPTPAEAAGNAPVTAVRPIPAIVRNLIKWGMPPVVLLTFLEPSGRHRAEVLTRTAVVVPIQPEADEPPLDEE